MAKDIILRKDHHIGEASAEDDDLFLNECFVDVPQIGHVTDFESPKSIILGRTGSGKSAIIREIYNKYDAVQIDPKDVALEYISNTDILRFLTKNDFDVSIIFEIMWKHIIMIKVVESYFTNMNMFENAISQLTDRYNTARRYYEQHKNEFWKDTDITIKEITNSFSESIIAEISSVLSITTSELRTALKGALEITDAQRLQIEQRTKEAIGSLQLQALGKAIDGLNELMPNKQKGLYILIDDLDLDWASNDLRYQIIFALISVIKPFRKVRKLKLVCALRADLFERIMQVKKSETLQPEKFEGIITEIRWDRESMKNILSRRIEFLFRHKYKKSAVKIGDIFPKDVRKIPLIDYLVDRTQMRPRDLIAFVNLILDNAAGSSEINVKNITNSEAEYSRKRSEALVHEWYSVHPCLDLYLKLLEGKTGRNLFVDFSYREMATNICLELDERVGLGALEDEVSRACSIYSKRENATRLKDVAKNILSILYKVGAIELKLAKQESYVASYRDTSIVGPEQIADDAAFKVSPMLWRKLGITPNIG